jgi:maltose O-acetyltransferase
MSLQRIGYNRYDETLKNDFIKAGRLLQRFNSVDYEDEKSKIQILTELFGSIGTRISIEHNFHCDLGYNIHVGENFYAGFNCTILGMAEV